MLEQLRRNWCIFSHWSSGKVISIILLLFHNLIPKCQQNLGRGFNFHAIVEPNRNTALIGAVVLEVLDFVVDCVAQELHPRDPNGIVAEIE